MKKIFTFFLSLLMGGMLFAQSISQFPFYTSFEDQAQQQGWGSIDYNTGDICWYSFVDGMAYDDSTFMISLSGDYDGDEFVSDVVGHILYSPAIDVPANASLAVASFRLAALGIDDDNTSQCFQFLIDDGVHMYYVGNSDDVISLSEDEGWVAYTVDLSEFKGQAVKVVVYHVGSDDGGFGLCFDAFGVNVYTDAQCLGSVSEFPFHESFEADGINCWSVYPDATDYLNFGPLWGYGFKSSAAIASFTYDEYEEVDVPDVDHFIVSPAFELPAGKTITLRWKAASKSYDIEWAREHYSIYISNSNNPEDFNDAVFSETLNDALLFTQRELDITPFAGQTVYIAFRHHESDGTWALILDDIEVEVSEARDCENEMSYLSQAVCEKLNFHGQTLTTSGVHRVSVPGAVEGGCDSIYQINLVVYPAFRDTITVVTTGSYSWNNNTYSQPGFYVYEGTTFHTCDSIVTLHLLLCEHVYDTLDAVEACDSYTWKGQSYTASTDARFTVSGIIAGGCDSIYIRSITIYPSYSFTDTVKASERYIWHDNVYTQPGTYRWNGRSVNGCDSIRFIRLSICNDAFSAIEESACVSFIWNGQTYNQSGAYEKRIAGVVDGGCDSVFTLVLTINPSYMFFDTVSLKAASYRWENNVYSQSGLYRAAYTSVNGCDSVRVLDLTLDTAEIGIALVDGRNIIVRSGNMAISVDGVEAASVRLFDLSGRILFNDCSSANSRRYPVAQPGIYFVQVENLRPVKVVVIR